MDEISKTKTLKNINLDKVLVEDAYEKYKKVLAIVIEDTNISKITPTRRNAVEFYLRKGLKDVCEQIEKEREQQYENK